jgi:hypothetical protein
VTAQVVTVKVVTALSRDRGAPSTTVI